MPLACPRIATNLNNFTFLSYNRLTLLLVSKTEPNLIKQVWPNCGPSNNFLRPQCWLINAELSFLAINLVGNTLNWHNFCLKIRKISQKNGSVFVRPAILFYIFFYLARERKSLATPVYKTIKFFFLTLYW